VRTWSADAANIFLMSAVSDAPAGSPLTLSELLLVARARDFIQPDRIRRGWSWGPARSQRARAPVVALSLYAAVTSVLVYATTSTVFQTTTKSLLYRQAANCTAPMVESSSTLSIIAFYSYLPTARRHTASYFFEFSSVMTMTHTKHTHTHAVLTAIFQVNMG